VFWIGLTLKGLDGLVEAVGGLLLLFVSPEQIGNFAQVLTQNELSEDPNDFVANSLLHAANGLTASASLFAAAYLLAHGLVKIVLVTEVLRGRLRAYPWMIAFLLAFIGFQGYEMLGHFSWGLALLTAFDAVIVWVIWREYRLRKSGLRPSTDVLAALRSRWGRARERRSRRR
jgi:uncharacterized membrane protein